jgi:hypothetical protein
MISAKTVILVAVAGSFIIVGLAYATAIVPGLNQHSTSNSLSTTGTQSTSSTLQVATTTVTSSKCSSQTGLSNPCDPVRDGIVSGFVLVGPAQPVCSTNGCETINMSGYSLVFVYNCDKSNPCPMIAFAAKLASNGSYSLELPAGNFTAVSLSPTCSWLGCPRSFPSPFMVVAGETTVLNITIDTGIR